MIAGQLDTLKILIWKDYLLRKHHWFVSILEILFPCLIIYLFSRQLKGEWAKSLKRLKPQIFQPYSPELVNCLHDYNGKPNFILMYTPNDTETQLFMTKVRLKFYVARTKLKKTYHIQFDSELPKFQPVKSENKMVYHFLNFIRDPEIHTSGRNNTLFIGIVFNGSAQYDIDGSIKYKIRIGNADKKFNTDDMFDVQRLPDRNPYVDNCFLTVQQILDSVSIEMVAPKRDKIPKAMLDEFPEIKSRKHTFADSSVVFRITFAVSFAYFILFLNTARVIVVEKQNGVKELMKMTETNTWMIWVGWLIYANMINIIVVTITTIMLTIMIDTETNPILIWLFLFTYINAAVFFMFAICAWFHRPLAAIMIGMAVYFTPLFIFHVQEIMYTSPPCLVEYFFTVMLLSLGFKIINHEDDRKIGVQFYNLFIPFVHDNDALYDAGGCETSLALIYCILILHILFYCFITLLIEAVRPGPYGSSKLWFHSFLMELNYKRKQYRIVGLNYKADKKYFEKLTEQMNIELSIRKLRKDFPPNVCAINNISIDVYKDQTTVFYGAQGAGKTTILSIIAGIVRQSLGTVNARIPRTATNLVDTNLEITEFRKQIGYCPQNNIHCSYLTVLEHLILFGVLNGKKKAQAEREARQIIKKFDNFLKKKDLKPNQLPEKMKRMLSIAISLVGSEKILVLDEPTTGMDYESKRKVWDMLLTIRKNRTILISTKSIEEASVVGDRIAIMDEGIIQSYGTWKYLKAVHKIGYNLNIFTLPNANQEVILDFIKYLIPGTKLKNQETGQLIFHIPIEKSRTFGERVFPEIEIKKQLLSITSISVTLTTEENLLLQVADLSEKMRNKQSNVNYPGHFEDPLENQQEVKTDNVSEQRKSKVSFRLSMDETIFLNQTNDRMSLTNSNKDEVRRSVDEGSRPSKRLLWQNVLDEPPPRIFVSQNDRVAGITLQYENFIILLLKKARFAYRKKCNCIILIMLIILILATISVTLQFVTNHTDYTGRNLMIGMDLYRGSDAFVSYSTRIKDAIRYKTIYERMLKDTKYSIFASKSINHTFEKLKEFANVTTDEWDDWRFVIGVYLTSTLNLTGFYSRYALHSSPISLNFISNTILQSYNKQYSITTFNHPFSEEDFFLCTSHYTNRENFRNFSLSWTFLIPLGLLFVLAFFLIFPQTESQCDHKHLQIMAGVSPIIYWFSLLIFDFSKYFIITLLFSIPILVFDFSELYLHGESFFIFILIFNLFGLSGIVFVYFFSICHTQSPWGTAFGHFINFNFFFLMVAIINVHLIQTKLGIDFFGNKETPNYIYIFNVIFMLNPFYCLSITLNEFARSTYGIYLCKTCYDYYESGKYSSSMEDVNEKYRCNIDNPLFKFRLKLHSFGLGISMFLIDFVVYLILIILIEYNIMKKFRFTTKNTQKSDETEPENVMIVENLTKSFGKHYVAVESINFTVRSAECLGIYGKNGIGKTTTLKMLTGRLTPTSGTCKILTSNLSEKRKTYLKQIGYCPQSEGLNKMMTGHEMLYLFGIIRGLKSEDCLQSTEYWLKVLDLYKIRNKYCGSYNRDDQRKLCLAIALIGDPIIIILDEPTSYVTTKTKKQLRKTIADCQQAGQSIILSTESTHDCDTLCNRLAYMVDGRLVCVGNIEYLKNEYCQGFTIMLKLKSKLFYQRTKKMVEQLKSDMNMTFGPNCLLKEENPVSMRYHLTDSSKTWAYLFKSMEDIKVRYIEVVEQYTISEPTLEQAF